MKVTELNSLKTILSRLTTLPKAENALNDIGISIKNQSGDVRQASDIIDELAGKWTSLSSEEQQHTAISVAGKAMPHRQVTVYCKVHYIGETLTT